MPAWAYDSYANDNVQEVIDETDKNEESINAMVKDVFDQVLDDYPSNNDLEFLVGIIVWALRSGFHIEKKELKVTNDIVKYLLENSDFSYWKNPETRKTKLKNEKNLLIKGLFNKPITEVVLKKKTSKVVNEYL